MDYATTVSFRLLKKACDQAARMKIDVKVGGILGSDNVGGVCDVNLRSRKVQTLVIRRR